MVSLVKCPCGNHSYLKYDEEQKGYICGKCKMVITSIKPRIQIQHEHYEKSLAKHQDS